MTNMPSYGPAPRYAFFIFDQDETDEFAVHWRGREWGTDQHADLRGWYHDPLEQRGYEFLLSHYGLPSGRQEFSFDKVKKMSPQDLVNARRQLEKEAALEPLPFVEGTDY